MEIRNKILRIIEETVGIFAEELKMEALIEANDIDELDFLNMIIAVEEEFNVDLEDLGFEDIRTLTVNDFIDYAETAVNSNKQILCK